MNAEKTYHDYWSDGKHETTEWDEKTIKKWFGPILGKGHILDYGCGMGYSYQRLLSQNCGCYTGADVSDRALEALHKRGFVGLKISEEGKIDAADSSFDAAVCVEVLEHLWDPLAAAKELHRVLKPGGVLIATVPNFGYLPWRLLALFRARVWSEPEDWENDPFKGVHIRFFSEQMFGRLFRYAGFESVKVTPFDECNIFDLFYILGPLAAIGNWLTRKLPRFCRMSWLEKVSTNVFAQRLRVVAIKKL